MMYGVVVVSPVILVVRQRPSVAGVTAERLTVEYHANPSW